MLDDDGNGDEPIAKRALSESAYQVWSAGATGVSVSTFYRNLRSDHWMIRKEGRRLDCCEKCVSWDNQVKPVVKRALAGFRSTLSDLDDANWSRWDVTISGRLHS